MKVCGITAVVSVLLVIWLATALVRVENERYALLVGLCRQAEYVDFKCLKTAQTRTAWYWHLYYALTD